MSANEGTGSHSSQPRGAPCDAQAALVWPYRPKDNAPCHTNHTIPYHTMPYQPYHTIQYPTMPYQPKDSAPCHTIPCIIIPGKAYYTMLCLSQDNLPYLLTMVGTNQRIRHRLQPRKGEIPLLSFGIIPAIGFNTTCQC